MRKYSIGMGILVLTAACIFLLGNGISAVAEQDQQVEQAAPLKTEIDVGIASTDMDAARHLICPEVIWAPATGGGTWLSRLVIEDASGESVVTAYFHYGTLQVGPVTLWNSTGYAHAVRFSNILSTIGALAGTSLYGQVGTLELYTQDDSHLILADVETINGNYGKTFPGITWTDGNSANIGRSMVLQNLTNTSTYRTFVGCWNGASGGYTMTIEFSLGNQSNVLLGSRFTKVITSWDFISFNPFVEAGVGGGSYDNCILYAVVQSADPSPYEKGLFWFGSKANNYTNDSAAMFPKAW